ncbi:filamentous hemagglutinin N-terminal domain-containing protein [Rhizobium rhizogenes]|uniref:two-partner secretion domain-containing protein n=1 Tax=Rhizobium rhizogenes TaxID=359 RepID=UPI0022BC22BF|nr:filamentous hemagglutinin N-terminal domain-containing protein [Rhizobium rhizogenes]MCZ7488595.1 filamentous hemagglutinin N-terminal domain-containing protein [Rhizobium rhizogenes]
MKDLARRIIAGFMAGLTAFQPVLLQAGEIVNTRPDHGPRPHLDQSYNGTDVLNIARPNGQGVSHDIYQKFSADDLIINNSPVNSNTQLGGWIEGNPNFRLGDSARLWIGEVIGGSESRLTGIIEAAGRNLDLVLANEHGITCNGCGFINIDRATLSTGIPRFSRSGAFEGLDVKQGNVTIGESGLNPEDRLALSDTSRVDVIARAAAVYGKMRAQTLNIVAGANSVDYDWRYDPVSGAVTGVTPQVGKGDKPALAIDVAALGGMYANAIQMVATENGVGVRLDGTMASATDIAIDASGRLSVGASSPEGVKAKQKITVRAQGPILLEGALVSENNDHIQVSGKDTLTVRSQVSGGAVQLEAAGETVIQSIVKGRETLGIRSLAERVVIAPDAALSAEKISIAAAKNADVDGSVKADTHLGISASGTVSAGKASELQAGELAITGKTASLSGRANAHGGLTVEAADTVTQNGALTAQDISVIAGTDFDNNGVIAARGKTAINARAILRNTGIVAGVDVTAVGRGGVANSGSFAADSLLDVGSNGSVSLAASGEFKGGDIALSASKLDLAGAIGAQRSATITAGQGGVDHHGAVLGESVRILSQGNVANDGTVDARSSLTVATDGSLSNNGELHTQGEIDLAARGHLANTAQGKISGDIAALSAETVSNAGTVVAGAAARLLGGRGGVTNSGIVSARAVLLESAAHIVHSGNIAGSGTAAIKAKSRLDILAGSVLRANTLAIEADSLSLGSTIAAQDKLEIVAGLGDFDQSGTLSGSTISISAGSHIRNSGIISAGKLLSVETKVAITNAATMISGKDARLYAPQLINNGGVIWANDTTTFAGDAALNPAGLLQNTNGRIEAFQGDLTIRADEVHNLGTAPTISSSQIIKWTEKGRAEPTNPTEEIIKLIDPAYLGADGKVLPSYAGSYAALWADVTNGGKALSAESRAIVKPAVLAPSGTRLADDFVTLWSDMFGKANAAGTPSPAAAMRALVRPEMFDGNGIILSQYAGAYAALWDTLASGGNTVSDDVKTIMAPSALVVLEERVDPKTGAVTLVYSNTLKPGPAEIWSAMKSGAGASYDIIKILYQDRFNDDGALAELVAGGNVDIVANRVHNVYGNISAGRNISITANDIKNQAIGASQVLAEVHKKPGCFTCHEGKADYYDTFGGRIEANGWLAISGNLQNITEPTSQLGANDVIQKLNDYLAAQKAKDELRDVPFAHAKNFELVDRRRHDYTAPVEGNGSDIRKIESTDTGSQTPVEVGADPDIKRPDRDIATIPVETGRISDRLKPVSPVTPQLKPGASVDELLAAGLTTLAETNPEYTQYSNFITSNYMMKEDRLAYRDDIINNTDDPIVSALAKAEQRLPSDPDTSYLDKPVDVPAPDGSGMRTVYPAKQPLALDKRGALIKGDRVTVSGGTLETNGTIAARGDVSITVDEVKGTGGRISSQEGEVSLTTPGSIALENMSLDARSIDIVAGQDFIGKGIAFSAEDDITIFAGTGVTITSLEREMAGTWNRNTNYRTVDQFTSSLKVGGDLSIVTKGDLALLGVEGSAAGNIGLSASGDIALGAVQSSSESHTQTRKSRLDVAEIKSHVTTLSSGGDLTAVAGASAVLMGTGIDSGGKVTLAAQDDVVLAAAQDIHDYYSEKKSGNWFRKKHSRDTKTEVINKGVSIGARSDIAILAETGDLVTAGSSFVSADGNVDLTARDGDIYAGAYTDIYQETHYRKKSYFGGLIGSTTSESLEKRFATGTKALADLDLKLVSGGDTTLVGTQLKAGGSLSINTGGNLSVEAAINSMRRDYFSQKLGAVTMTTITEQSFREVALLTSIMAGANLSFNVGDATRLTLYDYAGRSPEALQKLYPQELLAIKGLQFLQHQLADEYFYDKQVALSPAFKAVVAIAVGAFVAPAIVSAVAPSLSGASLAAAKAFTSSFIVESIDGAVSGNYDLGKILQGAAFSGLSAGLTAGINLENLGVETSGLSQNLIAGFGNGNLTIAGLLETALDGVISNGLSAAVYGTDFGGGVLASVVSYVADGVAGSGIREISDITGHGGFSIQKLVAKAALNCLAAEAKGASCASGAVGSLVTELLVSGGASLGTYPLNIAEYRKRLELAAAIAGYFVSEGKGENVFATANAALIDYDHNAVPLIIWGIIALGGYVTYEGGGNPVEGLRVIARGEDIVSVLAASGTEAAIGFSSEHFPEQTAAVLSAITAAGEAANVAVTYVDEATGKTVSTNWAKLPQSTREAITGGFIVASIVIPSSAAPKIASKLRVASKNDRVIDVPRAPKGGVDPGTAYQVRFDPAYPGRPDPEYSVDTSTFTSGATTANGGVRNSRQFWNAWSGKENNGLSAENLARVQSGRAPVVDSDWLRTFPEHRGFEGQTLVHHHMNYGQYAIPVPRGAHNNSPGFSIWHPARGTE